ncbi:type II CAAX prenyl endopeptidase Rce1 family protein [uncultured Fibrella sp.]|uniref:CPBP family glutamic-type intramembrane protease n=1 Tax=uncultured Fibrella sp. TaxID=1284596 RepID=UPI0035CB784B
MTELLRDIRAYLRADFKLGLYLATAVWVGLLITLNYRFRLENDVIDKQPYSPWRQVWYFSMYATAYYGAFGLWSVFHNRTDIWRNRWFWLHTLVALVAYAYYAGFVAYSDWAQQHFPDFGLYVYVFKVLSNVHSLVTIVLPLALYYLLIDKPDNGFYGMRPKQKGLLVYATLLALMVPIITYASFQPDFLQSYPTYRNTNAHTLLNVPEWVTALGYELAYGWDFVPTELLFRGFLVIGLSRILQRNVPGPTTGWSGLAKPGPVLPMIVWYATIHFGRPLGETISSLFGGYILGVLALSTRSIWGGLLIHIGIAWLMEAAAFWQKM